MSLHWTYRDVSEGDLLQGDILERTEDLKKILAEYHQYFCREQYTGFLVLTQSCDLVRGNGECKAPYISLAVICELEPLLPELLRPICGSGIENVYLEECRYAAQDTLRKVINQNDQARGLFYLHPVSTKEHSLKILATPSVGLLRVSIALRRQHYDILLDARRFHLDVEYANKLGWLSGNLFSRVATRDWEDQERDPAASEQQCNKLLDFITEGEDRQNWVPKSWLEAAKKQGMDLTKINAAAMRSELDSIKPPSPAESAAAVVTTVAERVIANPTLATIQQALENDEEFINDVAAHFVVLVEDQLQLDEAQRLREALINAKHGRSLATLVVRVVLQDFNQRRLSPDKFGETVKERTVSSDTLRALGTHLRKIVEDDQRAASIKNSAEGKPLFSAAAISTIEKHVLPHIPILRSASTLAENIGNRLKNEGNFKDAFRAAARS